METVKDFYVIAEKVYGYGDGSGYGSGDGSGYGYGVQSLNGDSIQYIDSIPTVVHHVRGDIAKGHIIDLGDFTRTTCYIVRRDGVYAHGKTLKEANDALLNKIYEEMTTEERVEQFTESHDLHTAYPNEQLFEWHGRLTGSCLIGREAFVKSTGIDMKGETTVAEFIRLTRDSYGGDVIAMVEEAYKDKT